MPQPVRLRAVVGEVVDHAPDLRSLVLAPERPPPRFRVGQFLHLAVDRYDPAAHWPESRIFSIASSPDDRETLRVTLSAVGKLTRRMMQLRAGDEVWLKLPYGDFFVEARSDAPAVLVAGGTGVTPFAALLSESVAPAGPTWLLYGARTQDLLVYAPAARAAAARFTDLRCTFFVETGEPGDTRLGRLSVPDALAAARELGRPEATVFYLSGPPAMLAHFKRGLIASGAAPERVRIDAWGDLP
jgi:ferredoxin-NADP reductase